MRVLLIDNYDSFAWNLVQALRAAEAPGGPVVVDVRRNDVLTTADAVAARPDAVVLSPGPKGPADAGISVDLVRAASSACIPLLGVCLGHQSIAAAFGGRVASAPRLVHGKTSRVRHEGGPLFEGVPSPFEAMRYHSLVVAEPLPEPLAATARAEGADGELMALSHRALPVHGVQFHPESYRTSAGPAILVNFLRAAARWNSGGR
ncbi:MAG: Anthranilate synthase component 2 [Planctomycetes bacterium]|nr:Anthranilate synthase component 2 [Planctomycetota bacterium]